MNNKIELNFDMGTISFWINANSVDFKDKKMYPFINTNNDHGSIFILKDVDNKIKFFYVYIGFGRTDIEYDCSSLENSKKHMVAVTWSQEEKEIKLYIDGELVKTEKIKY